MPEGIDAYLSGKKVELPKTAPKSEAEPETFCYIVTPRNGGLPFKRFSDSDPVTIVNAWDSARRAKGTLVWEPGSATLAEDIFDITLDDGSFDEIEAGEDEAKEPAEVIVSRVETPSTATVGA